MVLPIITIASWLVAVATYLGIILVSGGPVSIGDVRSLAIVGGVMAAIAVPIVYLPVMLALRRRVRSWWPFPVVGGLLGAVPLALFAAFWNGGDPVTGLFSEVGLILFVVFAAFGATFGAGFYFGYVEHPA